MTNRLPYDCFQHDSGRLSHAAALAQLRDRVSPITAEEHVPLAEAIGRVLANPLEAPHPVPNHTNSAVDGYAFAACDYDRAAGARLPVSGRSAAGKPMIGTPPAGSAVRIFTGAVMPPGLDTVAMQEDCTLEETAGGSAVALPPKLKPGANVRKAGEDVKQGVRLYEAGHVIRPQDMAALASIGVGQVRCRARLRVGVISTGDEVVRADGRALEPGRVFDANAPMIGALVALNGGVPTDLGVWSDRAGEVERRLADAAARFDVLLTSGGASRGEEDHIAAALAAQGSRHFWQIQVKPGRPMMLGQVGRTIMVGLPGNPVAVFVCFLMYVWPMLKRLGGAEWSEPRRLKVPAAFDFMGRKAGRREFWRGMLVDGPAGLSVRKYERDGSGLISSLREADCLIDIPEDAGDVHAGDLVDVIPFTEFGIVGR